MDSSWKKFERRIAALLGGERRGPSTSDGDGGKTDIIHEAWGVECKLLSRANHASILEACRQAERNSSDHQTPISIVKRKFDRDSDALVSMRLATWLSWYGPSADHSPLKLHEAVSMRVPKIHCPNCGKPLVPRSCKMHCETHGCGYFLSCSDLEPAT